MVQIVPNTIAFCHSCAGRNRVCEITNARCCTMSVKIAPDHTPRRKIKKTPPPLSFRGISFLSFRGPVPESRSWCKIIMSLWNNGDHPAPVILVFRNRPILAHNNKKYDYSGVARVRSHCMAPIPACAGMNPSEAQDAARTQSAGDT